MTITLTANYTNNNNNNNNNNNYNNDNNNEKNKHSNNNNNNGNDKNSILSKISLQGSRQGDRIHLGIFEEKTPSPAPLLQEDPQNISGMHLQMSGGLYYRKKLKFPRPRKEVYDVI